MSIKKRFFYNVKICSITMLCTTAHLVISMELAMSFPVVRRILDAPTIEEIERIISYSFKDKSLLVQALTTPAVNPHKNYERHEYLGDAVLDYTIAPLLLLRYREAPPGELTGARAALVSQEPLAALCLRLRLHTYIQHNQAQVSISRLCDIIESIIGAMYEDGGAPPARDFILRFFQPMLKGAACPMLMGTVIRAFAVATNHDIEYQWVGEACHLMMSPGTGIITSPKIDSNKTSIKRLARYCEEYRFIRSELPAAWLEQLVRLAIDDDYEPLLKVPELEITWDEKLRENYRMRLHTLMQKIEGCGVMYKIEENEDGFTSQIDNKHVTPTRVLSFTRRDAQEFCAERAYKEIQRSIILARSIDPSSIPTNDDSNAVTLLDSFYKAQRLNSPQYVCYFTGKNDDVWCYCTFRAPWLLSEIKGPARPTAKEAKVAVAGRVIELMKHACADCIDPTKLYQLLRVKEALSTNSNATGCLIELCQIANLSKPAFSIIVCEGPVTEGVQFETAISISNNNLGAKTMTGIRAPSKIEAQEAAAKKVLLCVVNKLLKREVLKTKIA